MKFRFGLENVLKHRQRCEEVAQREYAEAQFAVDECLRKLEAMYQRMDEVRVEIHSLQKQGTNQALVQINEMEHFLKGQLIRIEAQREQARQLLMVAEQKQEALVLAAQESKILEKLKDKKMSQHRERLKVLEAKQLDDLTMTRVVWRKT